MGKFLKPGRVVILLAGRYAGKKAVLIKANEKDGKEGKEFKFSTGLLLGLSRYPRKVHNRMSTKTIKKRTSVKTFVKSVNLNHIMPTRYRLDESFLKEIRERIEKYKDSELKQPEKKKELNKNLRQHLAEKYRNLPGGSSDKKDKKGHSRFLFTKLRF